MILLNQAQLSAAQELDWLYFGPRAVGKSFVNCVVLLQHAFKHPGTRIKIRAISPNGIYSEDREEFRTAMNIIANHAGEKTKALFLFNNADNSVVCEPHNLTLADFYGD